MEAELSTYKDQLAYVNLQLESDPNNEGLKTLKTELVELIDLTQQAMGHPAAGSTTSTSAGTTKNDKPKGKGKEDAASQYKAGMDCMAKYKDGKWYPAKINAVIGSPESPQYTITFKGYTTSTNVPLSSLRPHDPSAPIPTPVEPTKRKQEELTEKEKEKKKKKGEKWMESQKAKADEIKDKKSAWEKFGKKASKKGIHISGLEGKSVFRTPDNPFGKVGVTGSGRGVTEYERMGKHKFATDKEE